MSKKHTIEEVKNYVERLGYKLISKEYLRAHEKLILQDYEGYLYTISFANLYSSKTPSRFHIYNPYTIHNITLWCKLNEKPFELLSSVYKGNDKHLQWKCLKEDCGEIFPASWGNILTGYGCGFCCTSPKKVGVSNCLATKNPELVQEWHPELNNNLTPYDFTANSHKYAFWLCRECGHEWEAIIANRNDKGRGCPECSESKGEIQIREWLKTNNIYYIPQKTFDSLLGLGNGNLSYDFYIPKYSLLIEYQGEQHEHYCKGFHQSKKDFERQSEHDKRKKNYALSNRYNFLEIWYWDYDNIEQILSQYISMLEENFVVL